jgi:hypothetical protein
VIKDAVARELTVKLSARSSQSGSASRIEARGQCAAQCSSVVHYLLADQCVRSLESCLVQRRSSPPLPSPPLHSQFIISHHNLPHNEEGKFANVAEA